MKIRQVLAGVLLMCLPMGVWGAKARPKSRTEACAKKAGKATAHGAKVVGHGTARVSDHAIEGTGKGVKAVGRGFKKLVT